MSKFFDSPSPKYFILFHVFPHFKLFKSFKLTINSKLHCRQQFDTKSRKKLHILVICSLQGVKSHLTAIHLSMLAKNDIKLHILACIFFLQSVAFVAKTQRHVEKSKDLIESYLRIFLWTSTPNWNRFTQWYFGK